jgi:hypothetical protein
MKHEVITRSNAAAQGRKHFYTGKPCKYGHDSARFVSTGGCMACNAARSKAFSSAVARNGRLFTYALHPDDVAAALAYCQALDLQRGRAPFVPDAIPRGAESITLPADIARHRATLLAAYGPKTEQGYIPAP